jgi:hypothetical protein
MSKCVGNVQICKWSPLLAEFMNYISCSYSITQQVKATICTFSHLHINYAFAHLLISTLAH